MIIVLRFFCAVSRGVRVIRCRCDQLYVVILELELNCIRLVFLKRKHYFIVGLYFPNDFSLPLALYLAGFEVLSGFSNISMMNYYLFF